MTTVTAAPLSTNEWLIELTFKSSKENYTNVLPILCLDESGSMNGPPIRSATDGAKKLAIAYLENNCPEVIVVRYHSVATTFKLHTLDDVRSLSAKAEGMTNFPAAIKEVISLIKSANATNHQARIYFFTDGQNTVDSKMLEPSIKNLRTTILGAKIPATMDVVGFTEHHDVNMLNSFAKMTKDGTFQYAQDTNSLEDIIGSLLSVSNNKKIVTMTWGGSFMSTLAVRDDEGVFRAIMSTTVQPTTEIKVDITGSEPIYLPIVKKELTKQTFQRYKIEKIRNVLQNLVQTVNTLSTVDERKRFDQELRTVDTDIDDLVEKGDLFRDLSRDDRRLIKQTHLELKSTVSQLYKARTTKLSTDEFATMLSTASAHVTKSGLQKKLQQRVLANMDNNDISHARAKGCALIFKNAPTETAECMLTLENYQQLAMNGDCLCICMSISRSQAAIADPSQVHIHKIQPTYLSLDAFRDAVEMKLLGSDDESVHGGFSHSIGKSSAVLEGMAREKINAVFPLYFDEESWSIAKLRIKEAFSWMATITWNGWSFSQMELIPHLVLAHAIREYVSNPNEYNKNILNRLVDTCKAIATFNIDGGTLADRYKKVLRDFISNPASRTVDVVPCITALIGIAYVYEQDVFNSSEFYNLVWEEYFRRELRWQLASTVDRNELFKMIAKKLHMDINRFTKINVTSGSDGAEAEMIYKLLDIPHHSGSTGSASITTEKWSWDPSCILPGDIQQAQQTWRHVNGWFSGEKSFVTDDIYLATTIQNMLQASNGIRRQAIQDGNYISPFGNATDIITNCGKMLVEHFQADAWARYKATLGGNNAQLFSQTTNIFQAAGLLHINISHFGNRNFRRFFEALTEPSPLAPQKISMILTGKFKHDGKEVQIFPHGWIAGPNRKWVHRWWVANGMHLTGDDASLWNSILPNYKLDDVYCNAWKKTYEEKSIN